MVVSIKHLLKDFPKAKAAKILRNLIEINESNPLARENSIKLSEYLI
jgi:hypothetical protein